MEDPEYLKPLYARLEQLNLSVGFDNPRQFLSIEQLDVMYYTLIEMLCAYAYIPDGTVHSIYDHDILYGRDNNGELELYPNELSGWSELISLSEEISGIYYTIHDEGKGIVDYTILSLKQLQNEDGFQWKYHNINSVMVVDIFTHLILEMNNKLALLRKQYWLYELLIKKNDEFWNSYYNLIKESRDDVNFLSESIYFLNRQGDIKLDKIKNMYRFSEYEVSLMGIFETNLRTKIEQQLNPYSTFEKKDW
jgi:hypothetical protein